MNQVFKNLYRAVTASRLTVERQTDPEMEFNSMESRVKERGRRFCRVTPKRDKGARQGAPKSNYLMMSAKNNTLAGGRNIAPRGSYGY